jgi:hypothetical protein
MDQAEFYYYAGRDVLGPAPLLDISKFAQTEGVSTEHVFVVPVGEEEWQTLTLALASANQTDESAAFRELPRADDQIPLVKQHLVQHSGQIHGPFDDTEFNELLDSFPEDSNARRVGMADWQPLRQYASLTSSESQQANSQKAIPLKTEIEKRVKPAPPLKILQLRDSGLKKLSEIATNPYVVDAKDRATVSANLAKLFASRIIKSDFTLVRATEEERKTLSASGDKMESALAQDYAAWRRAVMGIALGLFGVTTMLDVPDLWEALTSKAPILFKGWRLALFGTQVAAIGLLFLSVLSWTSLRTSRQLGRLAWCIQFFGPMALLLVPLRTLGVAADLATFIGISFTFLMMAKVFGMFSGLVRSALTLKTLLPQGRFTAWVVGAVAPFSGLFFGLAAVLAVQTAQTSLAYGFMAFTFAAIAPLTRASDLARPCSESEAATMVAKARSIQGKAIAVGLVFVSWHVIKVMKVELGLNDAVHFVSGFLANLLLVTLAAADLIIELTKKSYAQSRESEGTAVTIELEQRLNALR